LEQTWPAPTVARSVRVLIWPRLATWVLGPPCVMHRLARRSTGAGARRNKVGIRDQLLTNWRRAIPRASTLAHFPHRSEENAAQSLHRLPNISSGLATSLATRQPREENGKGCTYYRRHALT
jgi:hypothetical protein